MAEAPGPQGLPLVKPPWVRVTAIDLNQGEIVWQVPLGEGPRDHPALAGLDLPRLGTWPVGSLAPGWPLVTKTLLIVLQAVPDPGVTNRRGPSSAVISAFDKATGNLISEVRLGNTPGGGPMTYVVDGRQYLIVPVGRRGTDQELVAFALPIAEG